MREDLRRCDSINMKGPEKINLRTQEAHQWPPGAGPEVALWVVKTFCSDPVELTA